MRFLKETQNLCSSESYSTKGGLYDGEGKLEDDLCVPFSSRTQPLFRKETATYLTNHSCDSDGEEPRRENNILLRLMEHRTITTERRRRESGSGRNEADDEGEENMSSTCGAFVDNVKYSAAHIGNACTEIGNVHNVGVHEKDASR